MSWGDSKTTPITVINHVERHCFLFFPFSIKAYIILLMALCFVNMFRKILKMMNTLGGSIVRTHFTWSVSKNGCWWRTLARSARKQRCLFWIRMMKAMDKCYFLLLFQNSWVSNFLHDLKFMQFLKN